MTRKDIETYVEGIVLQAGQGYSVETNKLDVKREWYRFQSDKEAEFEFVKDVCAIANSYGHDTGIILFGVEDKKGQIKDTTFKDSELRDPSELIGIITKRVDRPINIEVLDIDILDGKNHVSLIKINPTSDKPHVIRNYVSKRK